MQLSEIAQKPLLFRKKFQPVGQKFLVYDQEGNLLLFIKQKAFKLREDIRAYFDESQEKEALYIQARQILDFSAAYDVIDSQKDEKVGVLARKGLKSIIRDEWDIMDVNDQPIGKIHEDSTALALIRRFITGLVPQSFAFTIGDKEVAELKQHFNPFIKKADFKITKSDTEVDLRLLLAGGILLMAIEGRQG